jgi:hypothetical protein
MVMQAPDARHLARKPIQVGFVDAGRMGTGSIRQIGLLHGIRAAAIADPSMARTRRAFELCDHRAEDVVVTSRTTEAVDAVRRERPGTAESRRIERVVGQGKPKRSSKGERSCGGVQRRGSPKCLAAQRCSLRVSG